MHQHVRRKLFIRIIMTWIKWQFFENSVIYLLASIYIFDSVVQLQNSKKPRRIFKYLSNFHSKPKVFRSSLNMSWYQQGKNKIKPQRNDWISSHTCLEFTLQLFSPLWKRPTGIAQFLRVNLTRANRAQLDIPPNHIWIRDEFWNHTRFVSTSKFQKPPIVSTNDFNHGVGNYSRLCRV